MHLFYGKIKFITEKGGFHLTENNYSTITPEITNLSKLCLDNSSIDPSLYGKYDVKRGLRDINGKGVLTGLTEIAEVRSYITVDSEMIPCEGKLFYRGLDIEDIVNGFVSKKPHIYYYLVSFQQRKN